MTFHVGQKVVCIDSAWMLWNGKPAHSGFLPRKGSIYEVADVITVFAECTYVRLCEASWDEIYEASAFRPVIDKKTDISIFTEILRRNSKSRVMAPSINERESVLNQI